MRSRLTNQLFKAIEDDGCWQDILKMLIDYTGASKGIITLRNAQTAELILPNEVARLHYRPMLQGFDQAYVESYMDQYAALDPWTEIERTKHPYQPYSFSDYLPNEDLEKTKFWQWLKPQDINDAAVVELGTMPDEWIALNLHFDNRKPGIKSQVLGLLNDVLQELRDAWQLGEKFRILKESQALGQSFPGMLPGCYAFINEDFKIISTSDTALADLHRHLGISNPIQTSEQLQLPPDAECCARELLASDDFGANTGFQIIDVSASRFDSSTVTTTLIKSSKAFVGKRHAVFLVSVESHPIWEVKGLTRRQSEVIKHVAEGGTMPSFAARYDVAVSTANDHLRLARGKLGGISARDIYTTHQLHLDKTRQ